MQSTAMFEASHAGGNLKQPELAAEVTSRSRKLGVDAASSSPTCCCAGADGAGLRFQAGEGRWCIILCGPPLRCSTAHGRAGDLAYVAKAIEK